MQTKPNLLFLGAGAAAAAAATLVCAAMYKRLSASQSPKQPPKQPLTARKQKLADAEQKFCSMFPNVSRGSSSGGKQGPALDQPGHLPVLSVPQLQTAVAYRCSGRSPSVCVWVQVPVMTVSEAHKLLQEQPQQYVLVDIRNKDEQQVRQQLMGRRARMRTLAQEPRFTSCMTERSIDTCGRPCHYCQYVYMLRN